jgi:elongation factor Ts
MPQMANQVSAKDVSSLRTKTGAGMMDCKKALVETQGDLEKAVDFLRTKGIAKAEKRAGKAASQGLVFAYQHFTGKVGVLVEINCETDFVARTDTFQELAKDVALHVASTSPVAVTAAEVPEDLLAREKAIIEAQVAESGKPEAVREKMIEGKIKKYLKERVLLDQPFVKDDKKTVEQLVQEVSSKVGEKIVIRRIQRFALGEE